jgi:hypothetical protein
LKTITVSGVILVCCFLQLLFVPVVLLRSMGIGAAITVACTLLINLTLLPALLLAFPRFFAAATLPWRAACAPRTFFGCRTKTAKAKTTSGRASAIGLGRLSVRSKPKRKAQSARLPLSKAALDQSFHASDDDDDDVLLLLNEDTTAYNGQLQLAPVQPNRRARQAVTPTVKGDQNSSSDNNNNSGDDDIDSTFEFHSRNSDSGEENRSTSNIGGGGGGGGDDTALLPGSARLDRIYRDSRPARNAWYRWGEKVTAYPMVSFLVCVALIAPLGYPALTFSTSAGPLTLSSRALPPFAGFTTVGATGFSLGRVFPYRIIAYMKPAAKIDASGAMASLEGLFNATQHILEQLQRETGLGEIDAIHALPLPAGQPPLPWSEYFRCCGGNEFAEKWLPFALWN